MKMNRILVGLVAVFALPFAVVAAQQASYSPVNVTAAQSLVLVRGESTLADGAASVKLPDWFESEAKATGRSVFVSGRNGETVWGSDVTNGGFTIKTDDNGQKDQVVSWLVVAERK